MVLGEQIYFFHDKFTLFSELPEIEKICKGDRGCSKIGGTYSWKGDSYCDDKNNNEACDWDGGDCCGISWWNFWYRTTYCHVSYPENDLPLNLFIP